jgi:hypothetical protein
VYHASNEEVSKVASGCASIVHACDLVWGGDNTQQQIALPTNELPRRTHARRGTGGECLPACGDMKVYQGAAD